MLLRIRNKLNRIRGKIACRFSQGYQKNPGGLIHNAFQVGDDVAVIRYRAHDIGDWGAVHQVFHCLDYRVDNWSQGKALVRFYEEYVKQGMKMP